MLFSSLITHRCPLHTAHCLLASIQFAEIPNVSFSGPTKKSYNLVAVFQFGKHFRRQAQRKFSPRVITA